MAAASVAWWLLSRRLAGWRHGAAAAGAALALLASLTWIAFSIATCRTCG